MEFSELDIFQIEGECINYLRETILCEDGDNQDIGAYFLMSEGVHLIAKSIRQLINGSEERYEITDGSDYDGDSEVMYE